MDQWLSVSFSEHGGFAAQVEAAQQGDAVALGRVLEVFRPYLLAVANEDFPQQLWGKCGGSDLVQETLFKLTADSLASTASGPTSCERGSGGFCGIISRTGVAGTPRRNGVRSGANGRWKKAGKGARQPLGYRSGSHAGNVAQRHATKRPLSMPCMPASRRTSRSHPRNREHLMWEEIGRATRAVAGRSPHAV